MINIKKMQRSWSFTKAIFYMYLQSTGRQIRNSVKRKESSNELFNNTNASQPFARKFFEVSLQPNSHVSSFSVLQILYSNIIHVILSSIKKLFWMCLRGLQNISSVIRQKGDSKIRFWEIWQALFSWNNRFEIHPLALLPTILEVSRTRVQIFKTNYKTGLLLHLDKYRMFNKTKLKYNRNQNYNIITDTIYKCR